MENERFQRLIARVREFIRASSRVREHASDPTPDADDAFRGLALELFAAQFTAVAPYRHLCEARGVRPPALSDWRQIPAVPTAAFKEYEFTSLEENERTTVFHSSGTTGQRAGRHFHDRDSLALYEASLLPTFRQHVLPDLAAAAAAAERRAAGEGRRLRFLVLTPPDEQALHSSLAHMLGVVTRQFGRADSVFLAGVAEDGAWRVGFEAATTALFESQQAGEPVCVAGTAFGFVHLLDHLGDSGFSFRLPPGSRIMETGGYKGRSRAMPRRELYGLLTRRLGVPESHIVSEYGASELSSQAYDWVAGSGGSGDPVGAGRSAAPAGRQFRFPPWARSQVVSPETGREVADGETGLLRVFDLANVRSVMALQTEDLAVRRGAGFELAGRAPRAEPRGCSLMVA